MPANVFMFQKTAYISCRVRSVVAGAIILATVAWHGITRWEPSPAKAMHRNTTWWRHQLETFSALLAICAGNSPVPAQRPVTWSFDVFFDQRLNRRLRKQSWGWWFETLSCPLWPTYKYIMRYVYPYLSDFCLWDGGLDISAPMPVIKYKRSKLKSIITKMPPDKTNC